MHHYRHCLGWGAFCTSRTLAGMLLTEEVGLHTNVLELEAVVRATKGIMRRARVLWSSTFFSDNTKVVACIKRQGGNPPLTTVTEGLPLPPLVCKHDIVVMASHVVGKDNMLADRLSGGCVNQEE